MPETFNLCQRHLTCVRKIEPASETFSLRQKHSTCTRDIQSAPEESLRDREVACSASDRQGSNFESCVWRTVSSQSSHHPQEVLLAQFSLYVHKGGLKPDSFHFICARGIQPAPETFNLRQRHSISTRNMQHAPDTFN